MQTGAVAMNQLLPHIIPRLRRLAELEDARRQLKKNTDASSLLVVEIEGLRAVLPTSILRYHDGRRARGRISVAPVSRGVCGACHLAIPLGLVAELVRPGEGLNVCAHCGAFIYLQEEDQSGLARSPKAVAGGAKKIGRSKAPQRSKTSDKALGRRRSRTAALSAT
jgi:hypothetical protein